MVKSDKDKKFDLDEIINKARQNFKKTESGLGLQISSGSSLFRPTKDSDFVCWKDSHWEQLTGVRGIPFGRVVQIAGRPDSGKSTHAMAFMKQAQDQGHLVILWDSESKFSSTRFDKYFGGKSEELLVVSSKMILEGGSMVEFIVNAALDTHKDKKMMVVWDSVGGTLSRSEGEKEIRDTQQMAEAAKDNGKALRGFIRLMEQHKNKETNEERLAILLINQTYANIGSHGQKESGGQKVEFYSSLILQLTKKGDLSRIKDKVKRKYGILTKARVKKNHLFDGIDTVAELELEVAADGIKAAKGSPDVIIDEDVQPGDNV